MNKAYLNGTFLPIDQARISPMDRGFLFGDGIYEVIPSHGGRPVGFNAHLKRMRDGLAALEIDCGMSDQDWRDVVGELLANAGEQSLGVYLHVSRGADNRRNHAYPTGVAATRFAYAFSIAPACSGDTESASTYAVSTAEDLRWQRCNIKSTALLGNVMHLQQSVAAGYQETLLYNRAGELTEAAACNVFVIKDGVVATPKLDHEKLPGITRQLILDILRAYSDVPVEERSVRRDELHGADEVWITSSGKEIGPVTSIDGKPVGDGRIGPVWVIAQTLFAEHKFDY